MSTDWQSDLRKRGYRLTPQRQLVLEAVERLEHATPDELLTEVRRTAGGVNISTIYRTLDLLEELGLVSHSHIGHGPPTYHLAEHHDHMHLMCRGCEEVLEAPLELAEPFAERLRATLGFETDLRHFAIFGHCANCAAGHRAPTGGAGSAAESDAGRSGSDEPDGAGPGTGAPGADGPEADAAVGRS